MRNFFQREDKIQKTAVLTNDPEACIEGSIFELPDEGLSTAESYEPDPDIRFG